jgi:hypothetical protein
MYSCCSVTEPGGELPFHCVLPTHVASSWVKLSMLPNFLLNRQSSLLWYILTSCTSIFCWPYCVDTLGQHNGQHIVDLYMPVSAAGSSMPDAAALGDSRLLLPVIKPAWYHGLSLSVSDLARPVPQLLA